MTIKLYPLFLALALLAGINQAAAASPFIIGTNLYHPDVRVAFDGTNYLVALQIPGSDSGPAAQLISSSGALIGSVIAMPTQGDPPYVAFDGTNYLLSWADDSDEENGVPLKGQFINRSGNTVGSIFQIGQSVSVQSELGEVFGGTNYYFVWSDTNGINGQLVSSLGVNIGSQIFIGGTNSSSYAGLAFGGTNYLVTWPESGSGVYGQLISRSGSLVGANFIIDANTNATSAPSPLAYFDGTQFVVCYLLGTGKTNNHVYAALVTMSGTVLTNRIPIVTDVGNQLLPSVAYDGSNYLVAWNDGLGTINVNIKARFFNGTWMPLGTEFNLLGSQGVYVPGDQQLLYNSNRYLFVSVLGDFDTNTFSFDNNPGGCTAYGMFIPASTTPPTLASTGSLVGTQFPLLLTGTPGINYAIQTSTNLALPNWTMLVTNSPTNGTFSFTDTNATNKSRFYRAMKQ